MNQGELGSYHSSSLGSESKAGGAAIFEERQNEAQTALASFINKTSRLSLAFLAEQKKAEHQPLGSQANSYPNRQSNKESSLCVLQQGEREEKGQQDLGGVREGRCGVGLLTAAAPASAGHGQIPR